MHVEAAQLSPTHVNPVTLGFVCKLLVKFWKLHHGSWIKDVREREKHGGTQLGGGGTLYRLAVKLDTKDPDVKLAPSTLATYENAFAWLEPVCSNFRLFPCVSEDADGAELPFE